MCPIWPPWSCSPRWPGTAASGPRRGTPGSASRPPRPGCGRWRRRSAPSCWTVTRAGPGSPRPAAAGGLGGAAARAGQRAGHRHRQPAPGPGRPAPGRVQPDRGRASAAHLAGRAARRVRAGRPGPAEVTLVAANSEAVATLVSERDADLGFVEGPAAPRGLRSRVVATDRLAVVVRPDHPWARRRSPVRPAELAATPLVEREEGSGTRQALHAALTGCLGPGSELAAPALRLTTTTAIRQAVRAGAGPAVLSLLAVREAVAAGLLAVVSTPGSRPEPAAARGVGRAGPAACWPGPGPGRGGRPARRAAGARLTSRGCLVTGQRAVVHSLVEGVRDDGQHKARPRSRRARTARPRARSGGCRRSPTRPSCTGCRPSWSRSRSGCAPRGPGS